LKNEDFLIFEIFKYFNFFYIFSYNFNFFFEFYFLFFLNLFYIGFSQIRLNFIPEVRWRQ